MTNYDQYLATKERALHTNGFDVKLFNSYMKDFQKFSVRVAVNKAKFALFEDCGLGKTIQQLEWASLVAGHTDKPALILAPLAVVDQTINEGAKFNIPVCDARNMHVAAVHITNYEQLHNIDHTMYGGVVLDESSILKNFEGALRNDIINKFSDTPFKLPCSATPSPNDPMELGNHAEFLGVMKRNEMLATYFTHDGGETSKWRLKGHAVNSFYRFVNSWSLMFSKPSDIGFSDEGYVLHDLNFLERKITTKPRPGQLLNDGATSATNFHKEVRVTKLERASEVCSIVNNSNEKFIVWVEHNKEGDMLERMIPDAVQVSGSDSDTYKKNTLLSFANGNFRVLITKLQIGALGLNYQNCNNQVFASPDHSFEKIYQGIRRSYRFGQEKDVNIYMVITDTMQNVLHSFRVKSQQHQQMQTEVSKTTKELYAKYYQGI